MVKEYIVSNVQETIALGHKLGTLLTPHSVLTLSGDLGAGKTTFTKGIGLGLGIDKIINSPTFTILKQYQGKYRLSHFDAYRLEGQDDDLGFEEIFDSEDICVVEWANFIEAVLPSERLEITISKLSDTSRKIIFTPIGVKYIDICEEL